MPSSVLVFTQPVSWLFGVVLGGLGRMFFLGLGKRLWTDASGQLKFPPGKHAENTQERPERLAAVPFLWGIHIFILEYALRPSPWETQI